MLARARKKVHRHFSLAISASSELAGFELALGYPNGILVHCLNHSAKLQELQLPNRFPVVVQWLVLFICGCSNPGSDPGQGSILLSGNRNMTLLFATSSYSWICV